MSTQISPQIRIVALVGVLLIALAGASLFLLRHSKSSPVTVPPARTKPASTTHASTPPAATTPAVTIAKARPKPTRLSWVDKQLPAILRTALANHPLVLVALYVPHVGVDDLAVTEAHAGAAAAGVGFVRVNLLDDRVAGPLTALLPTGQMLPAPGILVYRFPGKVVYRYDGYLDREAVAQAAAAQR